MGIELSPVVTNYTGGFLTSMLQRVQPQDRMSSGVRTAYNTKDAAFLVKFVVIGRIDKIGVCRQFRPRSLRLSVFYRALFQLSVRF